MNPQLALLEDSDKLSDYVPGSTEVSRMPSRAVSDDELASESEPEDEEDQIMDEDEQTGPGKSASVLRREDDVAARKMKGVQKKEARQEMEDQFATRRATQATLKSADSIKRFSYLLGQTDLFRHFCDLKAQRDPVFKAMLAESERALDKGTK